MKYCRIFKDTNLFTNLDVVSIIHRDLYLLPMSEYDRQQSRLLKEANLLLNSHLKGKFSYGRIRVVASDYVLPEDNVDVLARLAGRIKAQILIVGSSGRRGLAYWMLGSFSEAAVLTSRAPVLVLKPQTDFSIFSKTPKILFAVDAMSAPSAKILTKVEELAVMLDASIHLLYVRPTPRLMRRIAKEEVDNHEALNVLQAIHERFLSREIGSRLIVKHEGRTVAHTISRYAEDIHPWLLILTSVKREKMRRLLLGSTARRALAYLNILFLFSGAFSFYDF